MSSRTRGVVRCSLASLLALVVSSPALRAQIAEVPGWTVGTFASVDKPGNAIEIDCRTGNMYVGAFLAAEVLSIPSSGLPASFAWMPGNPDELAINRSATFLFVKAHDDGGPIAM